MDIEEKGYTCPCRESNHGPERTQMKTPPHCCLWTAAWQQVIYLTIIKSIRTDPKENTTAAQ
jgi:hypothetical protein